jgi:hypothetical protein
VHEGIERIKFEECLLVVLPASFVFPFAISDHSLLPQGRRYTTVIVPFVLYGCETWCVTLVELWVMVSENRVLRGIFGIYGSACTC